MTPEMELECLLVSRDPGQYRTLTRLLHDFSITVDHCLHASSACRTLAEGSYDLVILDWEGTDSSELVHQLWSKRKKPTVIAISDDGCPVTGAHFTISKPIALQETIKSLKLAYSRMVLEYRLHARYAVMETTVATDKQHRTFVVTVTDIGDRGVGLKTGEQLQPGVELFFNVPLFGIEPPISMHVRVLWARNYGTAGCEIVSMPPVDRDKLQDWLKKKVRIKKPLVSVPVE